MKQQQPNLTHKSVADIICDITGEEGANKRTIGGWHKKFDADNFSVRDFVLLKSGKKRGLSIFSDKTIRALITYMHEHKHNAETTTELLSDYFGDVHELELEEVEVSLLGDYLIGDSN
jgi:hypothetical protein